MMNQISLFDVGKKQLEINKPIRLIELFGGIGTQAMALRNIGANFEHYRLVEWEVSCIKSYKAIHMPNDNTDYSKDLSKTELQERLFRYGISTDGKSSLSQKEIRKKPEKWLRETYNNIKATNNLCSICNIKGSDLGITETDKYCYIVTYSFPCQDLSVAGRMQGMSKGSGTRSGLLWEVERLLNEVEELPQILLMENVPQVISKKNIADFEKWEQFLTSKGYSNYVQLLNAKNYGVAQNRNRCFMVSVLGDYYYEFPKPIPLKKTMKDYLEDEVDEKYYINSEKAQKLILQLVESGQLEDSMGRQYKETRYMNYERIDKQSDIAKTLCAKDYKGFGTGFDTMNGVIEVEKRVEVISQMDNKMDNTFESANRVYDTNGIAPTINTCGEGGLQPKIVASRGRNPQNPSDKTPRADTEQRLEPNSEGICNTLTSVQKDNLVLEPKIIDPQGRTNKQCTPTKHCPTLRAEAHGNLPQVILPNKQYRIRKLTPKECWRLMGISNEDFHKAEQVNSNTQLYKQAGNAIVVSVLEAIFCLMNIQSCPTWEEYAKERYL